FPEPELVPVVVEEKWREWVRARIRELPLERFRQFVRDYELSAKEAAALTDEREVCLFYEAAVERMQVEGIDAPRAGRVAANLVLQNGAKRANERGVLVSELGITPEQVAGIAALREKGEIGSNAADELFGLYCEPGSVHAAETPAQLAAARGLVIVRDTAALDSWCDKAIAEQAQAAADVR